MKQVIRGCIWMVLIGLLAGAPVQTVESRPMLLETEESVALLEAGHDHLIDFRLSAAEETFRELASRSDGKAASYHYLSLIALMKGLMADEERYFEQYIDRADTLSTALQRRPNSEWKRLLEASRRLGRTLALGKQERYLRAAWNARSAYNRFEALVEDEPEFSEAYLGMGLLHIAVASLPSTFQYVLNALGFSGSVEEGMEELKFAASESRYHREFAEMSIAIFDITFNMKVDDGTRRLGRLYEERTDSPLVGLLYSYALYNNKQGEEAYQVVEHAIDRSSGEPFYIDYLDYYMAQTYFIQNEFERAEAWFEQYVDRHAGPALKDVSHYHLGLAREMQGDRRGALSAYEQVEARRDFDEDLVSRRWAEIRKDQPLNEQGRAVLRGENAFRWGDHNRAEQILRGVFEDQEATEAQRVHAAYTIGRLHHVQGNYTEAFPAYQFAIERVGDEDAMWAPWSRLYIGHMREQQGRYDEAVAAYEEANSIEGSYDYYQSLEQHVRFALERLPQRE